MKLIIDAKFALDEKMCSWECQFLKNNDIGYYCRLFNGSAVGLISNFPYRLPECIAAEIKE